jgi:hypothetical protein
VNNQTSKQTVRIGIVVGGALKPAAFTPAIINADIILHLDVLAEQKGKVRRGNTDIFRVPLGEGMTTVSLIEQFKSDAAFAPAIKAIRHSGIGGLGDGLGQVTNLGVMAYKSIQKSEMPAIFEDIMIHVSELTNGSPKKIEVWVMGSTSGGTGSGVCQIVAADLMDRLYRKFTNKTTIVELQMRVGRLTFGNIPSLQTVNINHNNIVNLSSVLARVTDPETDQIRQAVLFELPMVGTDTELRNMYAAMILQAYGANSVQDAINLGRNNQAITGGILGRIACLRAGVTPLDKAVNVPASAAVFLMPRLMDLLSVTDEGTVPLRIQTNISVDSPPRHHDFVQLMASDSKDPMNIDMVLPYLQAKYRPDCLIMVQLSAEQALQSAINVDVPKSAKEFTDRLRELLRVLNTLKAKQKELVQVLNGKQEAYDGLTDNIMGKVKKLRPEGFFGKGRGLFVDRQSAVEEIAQNLSAYPQAELELKQAEVELEALKQGITMTEAAIKRMKEFVEEILDSLQQIVNSTTGAMQEIFILRSVDEVFVDLLTARQARDTEQFEVALFGSVAGVTQKGLARILGLEMKTNLTDIANKLIQEPAMMAPQWSGRQPKRELKKLIVIPQLEPTMKAELSRIISALTDDRITLLETDTVLGGLAVVMLSLFGVTANDELLGFYAPDVELLNPNDSKYAMACVPNQPTYADLMKNLEGLQA